MPTITIRDLRGGLIRDYVGGNSASVEGAPNQYARSNGVGLFRPGFVGHISPAEVFSTGATTNANINSLSRNIAIDVRPVASVYHLLGGLSGVAPSLVEIELNAYVGTHAITPHGGHNFTTLGAGTGFWGEDVIIYTANVGGTPKTCIFYSWNDSGLDGDVGRYDIDGTAYDDDFMSTIPVGAALLTTNTTAVPRRLLQGPDKKLYITNGRYVASYDGLVGADGTYNGTAYDLGAGWIATDLSWDGNYLVISAVQAGSFTYYTFASNSKVCYWDGVEPGLGIVYDIPDNFISTLFKSPIGMLCFTSGKNNSGKLMDARTGKILPGAEWMIGLHGMPPKPNQVEFYQDNIVWVPGDSLGGFVMAYSLENRGLHIPYLASQTGNVNDVGTGGFLKNIEGNNLYLGFLISGTYKIVWLNGFGLYSAQADLKTRVFRLPFKSNITKIRAYFSQMASGSSVIFSLFKNYKGTVVSGTDDLLNKTLTFAALGALDEREILNGKVIPNVSAFYMNFELNRQISIAMVEVEYERVEKNS